MRRGTLPVVLAMGVTAACLGDPVGAGSLLLVPDLTTDSIIAGHPGEALPQPVSIRAVTSNGGLGIAAAKVEWITAGAGAKVQAASSQTDAEGYASAQWILGTKATDQQTLNVRVTAGAHTASLGYRATAVPDVVKGVHFVMARDSTIRLGDSLQCVFQAVDPFGNIFPAPSPRFVSVDTSTIKIDSTGRLRALKRGQGAIVGAAAGVADTARLSVVQIVQTIATSTDSFRFHSIGQIASDSIKLIDDRGLLVKDSAPQVRLIDTTIAHVVQPYPLTLRSNANGATLVQLQAGSVVKNLGVAVAQQASSVQVPEPSVSFDALGDTVRLTATVVDSLGVPLSSPQVTFASTDSSVVSVAAGGLVRSRGNGTAFVLVRANGGVTDTVSANVSQKVSTVKTAQDSVLFNALGATAPVHAVALDRLGSPVSGAVLTYRVGDTTVATVAADGTLRARSNGSTWVVSRAGGDSALTGVRITQRPVRIVPASDTIRITAIGDTAAVAAKAVDSLGYPLGAQVQMTSVTDTTVVALLGPTTLVGRAKGTAVGTLTGAGLSAQVAVAVNPLPAKITAQLLTTTPIAGVSLDSLVPLSCRVFDHNGNVIDTMPAVAPSSGGRWAGQKCGSLLAQRSGFDTIRVQAGSIEADVPLVLAIRPTASSPTGDFLQFDSLPAGTEPWAPTARRNSRGQVEIYFAAYAQLQADLHRLVSTDGITFHYDGVVLQHDLDPCAPQGSGIENVSIVPRADAPGWRMFYAGGSFNCYGWQVFSAVSTDERIWTKEPGVRLTNGGTVPPDAPVSAPWPVGEGIVTEQLPSGEWRIVVGGYEQILPYENQFQIVEWRSRDQLNWSYVGPVLTTREMPPGGQGTIYSPTIRQIAPGLWRMIFSGDNRFQPGWRGGIWSAVSTDERVWYVEGELMGGAQTRLWYASLVDDRLIVIRQDDGDIWRLAIATVTMP